MRRLAWCALTFVAGCGNLDGIDNVHDLRMLGVRATPPEQNIDPNALAVGASQGATSTAAVQIDALVADPLGNGRTISYTFSTCTLLDPNASACLGKSPGYQVLTTGTTAPNQGSVVISTVFAPSDAFVTQALQQDNYHGLDGLRVPVQLSIAAGNEQMVGVKLVVYTPPFPGITNAPHNNPNIAGITVDGAPWPNNGAFTFSMAQRPTDGWNIAPVFDGNAQATYQLPSFQGKILTFTESWLFDYFSTFGDFFSLTTAGGFQIASNAANATSSKWKPADGTAPASGTFYVVVRDGRGGENWTILQAVLVN